MNDGIAELKRILIEIINRSDNDAAWLELAKWFEDNGIMCQAQFIRSQIK